MTERNEKPKVDATVADVAEYFGVTDRTVRRWLKDTDIPHRRIGGAIRFNMDEVDEWSKAGEAA